MSKTTQLANQINRIISQIGGKWGIYALDLRSKKNFIFNADKIFETMSVIKFPILAYLFKKVDEGKVDLQDEIIVKRKYVSTGSGVLQSFSKRPKITIYDLALLMIIVSDNTATNAFIDILGINNINKFLKLQGFTKTKLTTDKIHFPLFSRKLGLGKTTPREMGKLYEKIIKNKIVSKENTKKIIKIMKAQEFMAIGSGLPYWIKVGDRKSKIGLVASKSGSCVYEKDNYWSIRNDVAYIKTKRTKREYIISIFSEGIADENQLWTGRNKYSNGIARISNQIFKYFESHY